MLIALKLTDSSPVRPEIVELQAERAVYDHFTPSVKIIFKDIEGGPVEEQYRFDCSSDFELDALVDASPLLSSLTRELKSATKSSMARVEETLRHNKRIALENTAELARTYGALARFFGTIGEQGNGKLFFLNADHDELVDMDRKTACDAMREFIRDRFDSFDLSSNIGALVLPGLVPNRSMVHVYGKLAHENKCRLYMDFPMCESFAELRKEFVREGVATNERELGNTVMIAAWSVGRKGEEMLGIGPVYLPGSLLFAANQYRATESGEFPCLEVDEAFCTLDGTGTLQMELDNVEIETLCKMGLIVAERVDDKVVFRGDLSLYNGSDIEHRKYARVQLADWIHKVLIDHCTWGSGQVSSIRREIQSFMVDVRAAGLIEEVLDMNVNGTNRETGITVQYLPCKATQPIHVTCTVPSPGWHYAM
ncbi:MAG: hypothetical protein KA230_06170 [Flavobacteriales bacterium]|nr:hypothetical protein [Flavobacteriales bacterium]